ncbi:MAG TPA: hypothetical protein VEZ89_05980, partial [Rubrivivax sp.]|nr:hypothetical protein [Rubrivivax sp.]
MQTATRRSRESGEGSPASSRKTPAKMQRRWPSIAARLFIRREWGLMKRLLKSRLLATAAAAVLLMGSAAHGQSSVPTAAAEGGKLWFVELTGAPTADGNSLAQVRGEKASFRNAARAAGIRYTERRAFDVLFNGFSIEVDSRDRSKLSQLPGVKAIYPVDIVKAPTPEVTEGAAPDLAAAIAMTGANIAQTALGLTGAGIKVAVMDTGIDIDHPDFGGTGVNGTTPF